MKITPIKDETDIFRDLSSNAIVYKNTDDSTEKRNKFFRSTIEDINTLKREVSEIKDNMNKILEILSRENNT